MKAHDIERDSDSFEALVSEVMANRNARVAYEEHCIRHSLARAFEQVRASRGLSVRDLAREMGTSISQVQRVLLHEVGGSLTLRTICRAADSLGLSVSVHVSPGSAQRVLEAERLQSDLSAEHVLPTALVEGNILATSTRGFYYPWKASHRQTWLPKWQSGAQLTKADRHMEAVA